MWAVVSVVLASGAAGAPVEDLGARLVGETPLPAVAAAADKPGYVRHKVLPGESLEQIAARYGTTVRGIKRTNEGTLQARAGKKLRIYARHRPAPRVLREHVVTEGEGWTDVSVAYKVRYRELRAWNSKVRSLSAGQRLSVWVEASPRPTVGHRKGPAPPRVEVRDGAQSVGRPQRGRLVNAVRLPESTLYELKAPQHAWGSSHAVRAVLTALTRFRHDSGYQGRLIVGAMSRRKGRRFRPHESHQSGRDIDIFLPLMPQVPFTWRPNPFEVDWDATWALVQSLVGTGQVEGIYLDRDVQRFLFEAGRNLGATAEELERVIEWPRIPGKKVSSAFVRHGRDHTRHIHVRFVCGPDDQRCYSRPWDERHLAIMERERAEHEGGAAESERRLQ